MTNRTDVRHLYPATQAQVRRSVVQAVRAGDIDRLKFPTLGHLKVPTPTSWEAGMEDGREAGAAVALTPTQASTEAAVLKEAMVEEVLARLGRGETVLAVARQFDIDPKTVRAWRARGRYVPRLRTPRRHRLDPWDAWLRARAPEVDYNAAVLYRELVQDGYTGSAMQVGRLVRPLRVAARGGPEATVRFV